MSIVHFTGPYMSWPRRVIRVGKRKENDRRERGTREGYRIDMYNTL